ncbi:hypothetical protein P43SY_000851 [Pythium insidiosum]|uniref:Uncharacterized protein n=1 Tax=Pythium insidiosum TaxID=114742 RepID=A0AAD5LVV5_PYTIN|nr:hypothetical protein P43SY_000851 [Pythium insidiosum]
MGLLPDAMRSSRAWMRTKMLRLRSCKRTDTVVGPPTTDKITDDSTPTADARDRPERAQSSPSDVRQRPKRLRKAASQPAEPPSDAAGAQQRSCQSCQRSFDGSSSKYLDYCSADCKASARGSGEQRPSLQRVCEWI